MKIAKVILKNYRNFIDEEINFNNQTLIIGPNDVGKTNMIRALRIVLDKSLSQVEIEPSEKDFNIFTTEEEFRVEILFDEYDETRDEHVRANLGTYFTEEDELKITYIGYKNQEKNYKIFLGEDENNDASSRYYLKCLNLVYLDSTRSLKDYINRAKNRLIRRYKEERNPDEIQFDDQKLLEIENDNNSINRNLESISYVAKSLDSIKEHLNDISIHNSNNEIKLTAYGSTDNITDKLELMTYSNGKTIELGGDGRNNQIYLTMWIEEIKYINANNYQTTLFVIEEPEAHLHPTLQSMTLKKILGSIENQIIVTTHSPKLAVEFNPNSIVRLYYDNYYKTKVSKNGCSEIIADNIYDMAYRNNVINGEMFFADAVLLVEGISEKLLYQELSNQLGNNIEKYNILILSVEGVGFDVYTQILNTLGIPFVIRTDNDIIKKRFVKTFKRC